MSDDLRYNKDNNNANDDAVQPSLGNVVERIQHSDESGNSLLPYVTKPGCLHARQTRKPADEFDEMDEVSCDDCHIGWFIKATS